MPPRRHEWDPCDRPDGTAIQRLRAGSTPPRTTLRAKARACRCQGSCTTIYGEDPPSVAAGRRDTSGGKLPREPATAAHDGRTTQVSAEGPCRGSFGANLHGRSSEHRRSSRAPTSRRAFLSHRSDVQDNLALGRTSDIPQAVLRPEIDRFARDFAPVIHSTNRLGGLFDALQFVFDTSVEGAPNWDDQVTSYQDTRV